MSMFCSFQLIKDASQAEVARIIQELGRESRCFVSPSKKSWIEVYDEKTSETFDVDDFENFMSALCSRSGKKGIAIWVIGSYYLCFWAYNEKGDLIVSWIPDDSEPMNVAERIGLGGPLAQFISFVCGKTVTDAWIEHELILPNEQSDLEGFFYQLCTAVSLPDIGYSYGDFESSFELQAATVQGFMLVERDGSCSGPLP